MPATKRLIPRHKRHMVRTHDTRPGSCKFGTHLAVGAHHSFLVPNSIQQAVEMQNGGWAYEFDGDLLIVEQIGTLEDDTKGPLPDLLADAIMNANNIRG